MGGVLRGPPPVKKQEIRGLAEKWSHTRARQGARWAQTADLHNGPLTSVQSQAPEQSCPSWMPGQAWEQENLSPMSWGSACEVGLHSCEVPSSCMSSARRLCQCSLWCPGKDTVWKAFTSLVAPYLHIVICEYLSYLRQAGKMKCRCQLKSHRY